jgi:hypothetical protein
MQRRAAAWLQIGAGERAHEYLRSEAKGCSGGQQRGCRLVPASEHEYLAKRMQRRAAAQAKRIQ